MVKDIQTLKVEIFSDLDGLSVEKLQFLRELVALMRLQTYQPDGLPEHIIKLGGLWQGYSFSAEEITAARHEVWKSLGEGFDE